MSHLRHGLHSLLAVVVGIAPLVVADPGFRHLVSQEVARHPGVAAYVPVATVVAGALLRALREKRAFKTSGPA